MQNIKECADMCTSDTRNSNLKLIVNGQYKKTMSKEDLELTRFIIGGMEGK